MPDLKSIADFSLSMDVDISETRIDWCREVINEFFFHGGLQKVLEKEQRKEEHEKRNQVTSLAESPASQQNGKHEEAGCVDKKMETEKCSEDVTALKYACSSV